jgi:hypothetical protein
MFKKALLINYLCSNDAKFYGIKQVAVVQLSLYDISFKILEKFVGDLLLFKNSNLVVSD